MSQYNIVAARPLNASNHLNSEFKIYERTDSEWILVGWRSIDQVSNMMRGGHNVRTGKVGPKGMQTGTAVEI
jgi:hypothetical protein